MRCWSLIVLALMNFGAIGVSQAQTPGDAAAGARKAWTCTGCHSIPGSRSVYPVYRVPKLGGQHVDYIVAALKAYKTQQRSHTTMQGIAATLSEQDMADLAAHFSAKPAEDAR